MSKLSMTLTISPKMLESFKAVARQRFPVETMAVFLGHGDLATGVVVEELYYPNFKATQHCVWTTHEGYMEAEEHARELDMTIVGDIHSHPYQHRKDGRYPDCSRSELDYEYAPALMVQGICRIIQSAKKRLRCNIRFWGPSIAIKVVHKK